MLIRHNKFNAEALLSAPRRSPGIPNADGTLVIFSVSSYSFATHDESSEIRLLDVKTSESSLLDNEKNSSSPVWLDGDMIALLRSTEEEKTELIIGNVKNFKESYKAGVIDGAADNLKITKLDDEHFGVVVSAAANPDGTMYSSKSAEKSHTSGRLYSSLFVRHWDKYVERYRNALWYGALMKSEASDASRSGWYLSTLVNALDGTKLESPIPTFGGGDHFDISKSGLIFVAKDPLLDPALNTKCNVYLVPLTSFLESTPTLYTLNMGEIQGASTSPVFSKDGKKAAFLAMRQNGNEADQNQIFVMPDVTRPAMLIHLLKSSDGKGNWNRNPSSITWSLDGSALYLTAENMGRRQLFYLPVGPMQAKQLPSPLTEDYSVGEIKPLRSYSDHKLFITSTSFVDSSIYSIMSFQPGSPIFDGKRIEKVSSASDSGSMFGISHSQVSEIWFQGAGSNKETDDKVHAWLIKPSGFDSSKKYPLAFLIHGGPQGAWMDSWSTRWNPLVFAEQGYVVVCPNPTGSTGYGQEFTDAIAGQWGGLPYQDLVNCFDYLEKEISFIDTDKAVALGASYGGYMCNWIQGHPLGRKFKALVTHDGVFSTTYELSTDELYFIHHDIGTWRPGKNTWQEWDPSLHTQHWKTPHLVIHSERDYRLLMGDGLAAFNVLQMQGVESEFLTFPDENHFVLKKENSLVWHETVFNWINKHVGLPLYKEGDDKKVRRDPERGSKAPLEQLAVIQSG